VVKHSQDKDQFLRVSLKRMQETQMYENELKEVNEYISALFAWLQEVNELVGRVFSADLIILKGQGLDVILGMS
jgi:hypothetical protein